MLTEMTFKIGKKVNESIELGSTDDFLSKRQMRSYTGINVRFITNEKICNTMLRLQTIQRPSCSWKHRITHSLKK